jgi:hypothetical protein
LDSKISNNNKEEVKASRKKDAEQPLIDGADDGHDALEMQDMGGFDEQDEEVDDPEDVKKIDKEQKGFKMKYLDEDKVKYSVPDNSVRFSTILGFICYLFFSNTFLSL